MEIDDIDIENIDRDILSLRINDINNLSNDNFIYQKKNR